MEEALVKVSRLLNTVNCRKQRSFWLSACEVGTNVRGIKKKNSPINTGLYGACFEFPLVFF